MTSPLESPSPGWLSNPVVSSSFDIRLRAVNQLNSPEFDAWLFLPGMLFDSPGKWWDAGGARTTLHEGLDIRFYGSVDGVVHHLDEGTYVVPVFSGRVVRIVGDFLGKSIFLVHDSYAFENGHLFTVYGHLNPNPDLRSGDLLGERRIFGKIARRKERGSVSPHLHISVAWVPDSLDIEEINWKTVGDRAKVHLLDPLSILHLRHKVVERL